MADPSDVVVVFGIIVISIIILLCVCTCIGVVVYKLFFSSEPIKDGPERKFKTVVKDPYEDIKKGKVIQPEQTGPPEAPYVVQPPTQETNTQTNPSIQTSSSSAKTLTHQQQMQPSVQQQVYPSPYMSQQTYGQTYGQQMSQSMAYGQTPQQQMVGPYGQPMTATHYQYGYQQTGVYTPSSPTNPYPIGGNYQYPTNQSQTQTQQLSQQEMLALMMLKNKQKGTFGQ